MNSASPPDCEVRLREAVESDLEKTLDWQCEPGARQYFRNPNPPTRSEHENWFQQRLARPNPALWIVELEGLPVGTVRLDGPGGPDNSQYEVSLLIASPYRGKGIGAQALNHLRAIHTDYELMATISPQNKASITAFERAGFRQTTPTCYKAGPLSDGNTATPGKLLKNDCS